MSVLCIGGRWVLDHLDEKHDFETRLTRAGFRHEEFTLHVKPSSGSRVAAAGAYEVKVTHSPTQTVKVYCGGPEKDWVDRFSADLSGGLYGQPALAATHGSSQQASAQSGRR
jgi:hypothetical protein